MSDTPGEKTNKRTNKKLRYVGIIASLAALAIVLSPVSPLSLQQLQSGSANNANDALPKSPQPEDISDEDLAFCNSMSGAVDHIVGGGPAITRGQELRGENITATEPVLSPQQRVASDILVGEMCNRIDLVHEIANTSDPGTSLVAYGCDSASGRIGDAALRNSLEDFQDLYCTSASEAIRIGADSLIEDVQAFKADIILARENNSAINSTAIVQTLDEIIETANMAKEKVDSSLLYEAASLLNRASDKFAATVEKEQTQQE